MTISRESAWRDTDLQSVHRFVQANMARTVPLYITAELIPDVTQKPIF